MSQSILEVRIFGKLLGKAKRGWLCSRSNGFVKVKANIRDLPAATGAGSLTSHIKVPNNDKGRGRWHHELKVLSILLLYEYRKYHEVRVVGAARGVGIILKVLDVHTEWVETSF